MKPEGFGNPSLRKQWEPMGTTETGELHSTPRPPSRGPRRAHRQPLGLLESLLAAVEVMKAQTFLPVLSVRKGMPPAEV